MDKAYIIQRPWPFVGLCRKFPAHMFTRKEEGSNSTATDTGRGHQGHRYVDKLAVITDPRPGDGRVTLGLGLDCMCYNRFSIGIYIVRCGKVSNDHKMFMR